MHDNRIFNVNGKGDEMLLQMLKIAFKQNGMSGCKGWMVTPKHGLILLWCKNEKANLFPTPLSAEQCLPFITAWLKAEEHDKESKVMKALTGWDREYDFGGDGSNDVGWRVYCEDWGHVNDMFEAICAIKPVYLWYGK